MKLPFFKDDSITIEAIVDGQKVIEVIKFRDGVTASEMANVKLAWEAGFAQGLARASNTEKSRREATN